MFIVALIIAWVILRMISKEVLGRPIGEVILSRRRVHFQDIDVDPHLLLYRQVSRSAKLSRGRYTRLLYLQPAHRAFYSTEPMGLKRMGIVVGHVTYPSVHFVTFKQAWWRVRRWVLITPPDTLLSASSARNLIYEGIGLNVFNHDWSYPIPSPTSQYSEEWMHAWALRTYDLFMKMLEKIMLSDRALYLMWKASDDPTEVRMAMQGMAQAMEATEAGNEETTPPQTSQQGGVT